MKNAFYSGLLEKYRLDMTTWDSKDFEEVLNKLRTKEGQNIQKELLNTKQKEAARASSTTARKQCTYCGKPGHEAAACFFKSRDSIAPSTRFGSPRSFAPIQTPTASIPTPLAPEPATPTRAPVTPIICFRCHQAGHTARECPNSQGPKNVTPGRN